MIASLAERYGIGCGDNSCVWGSRGGMGTNGGCRCFDTTGPMTDQNRQERRRARRAVVALEVAAAADPELALALDQLVLAVRVTEAKR